MVEGNELRLSILGVRHKDSVVFEPAKLPARSSRKTHPNALSKLLRLKASTVHAAVFGPKQRAFARWHEPW